VRRADPDWRAAARRRTFAPAMSTFRDHFSVQAAAYAAFRPTYPDALLDWVAALAPGRDLAWDCATGSGQAARALASRFARVHATDASRAQLAHAVAHPGVSYAVAPAERSGLASASVDLVTVAQALHWFDVDRFYAEVRRVLRPGGALAAWSYGDLRTGDAGLDAHLHRFAHETLAPCWPPERAHVDDGYRTLPFPFREVAPPPFAIEQRWTLAELAGYLRSWSGTLRWQAAHGADPVAPLEAELRALWGDAERRLLWWPIAVRAGHVG
jgi:SAM-dependent methyltransferase